MTMTRDLVNQWLASRVPGAVLDGSGIAAVKRDEDTIVLVEVPTGSGTCHLYALVAPLPEDAREAALLTALELNRFGKPLGGCWIAWDPDLQMLTLCRNLELTHVDQRTFSDAIDRFIEAIDNARRELMPQPEKSAASALLALA